MLVCLFVLICVVCFFVCACFTVELAGLLEFCWLGVIVACEFCLGLLGVVWVLWVLFGCFCGWIFGFTLDHRCIWCFLCNCFLLYFVGLSVDVSHFIGYFWFTWISDYDCRDLLFFGVPRFVF